MNEATARRRFAMANLDIIQEGVGVFVVRDNNIFRRAPVREPKRNGILSWLDAWGDVDSVGAHDVAFRQLHIAIRGRGAAHHEDDACAFVAVDSGYGEVVLHFNPPLFVAW